MNSIFGMTSRRHISTRKSKEEKREELHAGGELTPKFRVLLSRIQLEYQFASVSVMHIILSGLRYIDIAIKKHKP